MAHNQQDIRRYLSENHSAKDIQQFFVDNFQDNALSEMAIALREHADAIIGVRSEVESLLPYRAEA